MSTKYIRGVIVAIFCAAFFVYAHAAHASFEYDTNNATASETKVFDFRFSGANGTGIDTMHFAFPAGFVLSDSSGGFVNFSDGLTYYTGMDNEGSDFYLHFSPPSTEGWFPGYDFRLTAPATPGSYTFDVELLSGSDVIEGVYDQGFTVTALNAAPVLDASRTPQMNTLTEDAGAPSGSVGTNVSNLIDAIMPAGGLDNVSDADMGTEFGIAIINTNLNLTCYYSLNGGSSWTPLGAVSESSARLLAAVSNNRIYCQPAANANGTVTDALTIRAWDRTSGTDGATADVSVNGGTTAFSATSDTVTLSITAVNDAPNATNLSAAETYTENTSLNLINIVASDVDSANVTATITLSNPAAGTLNTDSSEAVTSTYNAGTGTWIASGAISSVNTLLAGLTFTPTSDFSSNFTMSTQVSDGSLSVSGSKAFTGVDVPDEIAPTVVSVTPLDTTTDVLLDTDIVITFSEAMDTDSLIMSIGPCALGAESDECATYEPVWSAGDTVVTLSLGNGPFDADTEYTLEITSATDLADNDLAEYSWSFTTRAPYVLTEVTPIPAKISSKLETVTYHFSESGTGEAVYLAEMCGNDSEASLTEIGVDSEHQELTIYNLKPGKTYECSFYIQSVGGESIALYSNALHIGPFTVAGSGSGGGGSMSYSCRDPLATNYKEFGASNPSLCTYATTNATIVPVTATVVTTTQQPNITITFTRDLYVGVQGADVTALQKFLNTHGFPVATEGLGSLGNETDMFGTLTRQALIQFQTANNISPAIGFFGPVTRGVVNGMVGQ